MVLKGRASQTALDASFLLVDGPNGGLEFAVWETGTAGSRSIHSNTMPLYRTSVSQSEISFLEYRLAVVESWPSSARKQATIEGILYRLNLIRPSEENQQAARGAC